MPTILKYKLPLEILMMIDDVLRQDLMTKRNMLWMTRNELKGILYHNWKVTGKLDVDQSQELQRLNNRLALTHKALACLE